MEQIAHDIYPSLQYAHMVLFGLLALFSESWRRCAILLLVASIIAVQIDPLVQFFKQTKRPLHVFWTYATIDIVTCVLVFCARFDFSSKRFFGSTLQAAILFASTCVHMYTSVEFYLYGKGAYENGPAYDYYLTLCALLSTMQIAIGLHGIPESINNIGKFFALCMDRRRLGLVLGNISSSMRYRAKLNKKLFG